MNKLPMSDIARECARNRAVARALVSDTPAVILDGPDSFLGQMRRSVRRAEVAAAKGAGRPWLRSVK